MFETMIIRRTGTVIFEKEKNYLGYVKKKTTNILTEDR